MKPHNKNRLKKNMMKVAVNTIQDITNKSPEITKQTKQQTEQYIEPLVSEFNNKNLHINYGNNYEDAVATFIEDMTEYYSSGVLFSAEKEDGLMIRLEFENNTDFNELKNLITNSNATFTNSKQTYYEMEIPLEVVNEVYVNSFDKQTTNLDISLNKVDEDVDTHYRQYTSVDKITNQYKLIVTGICNYEKKKVNYEVTFKIQ
jgi:hypothetical protein